MKFMPYDTRLVLPVVSISYTFNLKFLEKIISPYSPLLIMVQSCPGPGPAQIFYLGPV